MICVFDFWELILGLGQPSPFCRAELNSIGFNIRATLRWSCFGSDVQYNKSHLIWSCMATSVVANCILNGNAHVHQDVIYALDSAYWKFDIRPQVTLASQCTTGPIQSNYLGRPKFKLPYSVESNVAIWSRRIQLFNPAGPKYNVWPGP